MEYFAIYAIAGFLTFAHVYHRTKGGCEVDHVFAPTLAGFFWFLYWPGRAAIFLTKPKETRA